MTRATRRRFAKQSAGPRMHVVPRKSIEQQDLQALHRIRSRLVGSRTQLGNQIRGLLAEYGIVLPLHLNQVRQKLPLIFSEDHPLLTSFSRELFASLYEELCTLDERIQAMEAKIQRCSQPMIDASRLPRSKGLDQLQRRRSWQQSRMRRCFAMGDS